MFRTPVALALLVTVAALAGAQSASAPLVVSATVVSTCRVEVPRSAEASVFSSLPVALTCVKRGAPPRVQRPVAPRRSDVRDAVLVIDF